MESKPSSPALGLDLDKKLSLEDKFRFACGPHVPCFTECCGKLELLLTPYDVLRLRKRLQISSAQFLDDYTVMRWKTPHGFPEILMRMDRDSGKRCPFVTVQGCSVYEDRPGACRIYPLGRASTEDRGDGRRKEFYFTVREDHCKGFEETNVWTVGEWLADQGMEEYNRMNDLLMELYVRRARNRRINLGEPHLKMFVMACYNTERFRDFVFGSGFLTKFDVDPSAVEALRRDDTALLEFAFRWLRFALFGEPEMKLRQSADSRPT